MAGISNPANYCGSLHRLGSDRGRARWGWGGAIAGYAQFVAGAAAMRAETWATSATAVSAAADEPYASGGSGGGGGASRAALREARFRAIFKLPPSETIAFEVTCAHYSRNERLLLHGRMYASPLFICFYSRIFSHRTQQVIPLRRIVAIEAKHSCFCIPDAIELTVAGESGTTGTDTHLFFASFQGRDRAIATLRRLWSSSGEKQPAAPSLAPPGRKKGVSSAGRAGSSSPKDVCSTARQTAGELSGAVLAGVTEEGEVEGVHEGPEEPVTMSELVAFTIPACTSCADVFDEFWVSAPMAMTMMMMVVVVVTVLMSMPTPTPPQHAVWGCYGAAAVLTRGVGHWWSTGRWRGVHGVVPRTAGRQLHRCRGLGPGGFLRSGSRGCSDEGRALGRTGEGITDRPLMHRRKRDSGMYARV
eukprot:COSAG01_NODE_862_length_13058_cov_6.823366_17_plen_418_part_00